jgi:hypothetical protein
VLARYIRHVLGLSRADFIARFMPSYENRPAQRRAMYDKLIAEQAFQCAICGVNLGPSAPLDHDHSTGQVRGVLCSRCNLCLGTHETWYLENREAIDSYLRDGSSRVRETLGRSMQKRNRLKAV